MAIFSSGTSNIELIEKNRAAFPPAFQTKSRLAYYSSLFNSVEINSTFYKLPRPTTLEKWANDVPDKFRFTLKLWREITHNKNLVFATEQLQKFMAVAGHIGSKKGALLIQLPASTHDDCIGQLEKMLEQVKRSDPGNDWKIAVEFRDHSWYNDRIYSLLTGYGAALVWHDRPLRGNDKASEPDTFAEHDSVSGALTGLAPFIYLRFHGPNGGNYKGSYSDGFLRDKARQIRVWLDQGSDVYAYFNNTAAGDAPADLITLNAMVKDPPQTVPGPFNIPSPNRSGIPES